MNPRKTSSSSSHLEQTRIEVHMSFLEELLVPLSTFVGDISDLEVMFAELAGILSMKSIALYRVNAEGKADTVCSYGPSSARLKNTSTLKNINLHIAYKSGKISSIPMPNFGDNIVIPIGIDNLFLAAGDTRHSREIAKVENTLFELVSKIIANSLRSMSLIEQANTDKLTGLLNRGALDRYILEWKNPFGKPVPDPLALCMIDIDHFKRFNDTFGHHVGDQVLKHVAKVAAAALGQENRLYRFGGEEMSGIVLEKNEMDLFALVDNMRKAIAETPLVFEGISYPITASVGLYAFWEADKAKKDAKFFALKYADKALYKAKETGRNKTMVYEEGMQDGK